MKKIFRRILGMPGEYESQQEYMNAYRDLNEQVEEKKQSSHVRSADQIVFEIVQNEEQLIQFADILLAGNPLVLNFEEIGISEANHMLSFLSGVVYVQEGEIMDIQPKNSCSQQKNLLDGSLREFINKYRVR